MSAGPRSGRRPATPIPSSSASSRTRCASSSPIAASRPAAPSSTAPGCTPARRPGSSSDPLAPASRPCAGCRRGRAPGALRRAQRPLPGRRRASASPNSRSPAISAASKLERASFPLAGIFLLRQGPEVRLDPVDPDGRSAPWSRRRRSSTATRCGSTGCSTTSTASPGRRGSSAHLQARSRLLEYSPRPPMTTLATIYRRATDVRYRILDDEAVVIRQRAGEVLGLNALGARLLDALDGERSVGAIVADLAADYTVERSELESDVLEFFAELAASGLIEAGGQQKRRRHERLQRQGRVDLARESALHGAARADLSLQPRLLLLLQRRRAPGNAALQAQYFALLDELAELGSPAALALRRRAARAPRLLRHRGPGARARVRRADQVERPRLARRPGAAGARRDRPVRHRGQPARRAAPTTHDRQTRVAAGASRGWSRISRPARRSACGSRSTPR